MSELGGHASWRLWGIPLPAVDSLLDVGGRFGVVVVDADLRVRWLRQPEPAVYRASCGAGVDLVGRGLAELDAPAGAAAALLAKVLSSGEPVLLPHVSIAAHPEGFLPVHGPDGDLVGAAHVWVATPGPHEAGPAPAGPPLDSLRRALRSSQDALRLVMQSGRMGVWSWDRTTNTIVWDDTMLALFGVDEAPRTLEEWLALMPPEQQQQTRAAVDAALASGTGYELVRRIVLADGRVRHMEGRASVVTDASGEAVGINGITIDVTEREEARVRAERLAVQWQVLAEAGVALSDTLDPEQVLRRLTELVVPALADGCEVAVIEPGGVIRRIVHAPGSDPERLRRRASTPIALDDPDHPIAEVLRTGRPLRLTAGDEARPGAFGPPDIDTTSSSFGITDAVIVPLTARGAVVGALALGTGPSGRRIDDDLVHLGTEVAARASLSYDNARLFSRQRSIADTLQRSLVPAELPRPPWIELAGRYWVPGAGIEVGGDFYDVVEEPGRLTLLIGDVCGKGIEAASLTALARHTLRTALSHLDEAAAALRWLHESFRAAAPHSFVTVSVVRLAPAGDGSVRGEVSTAGHPRPLVLRADGTVDVVEQAGAALGLHVWRPAPATSITLRPGDVLLLYTDGVTDVPGDAGMTSEELQSVVAGLAGRSAEDVATGLGAHLEQRRPRRLRDDDIALVIARVPT